MGQVLTIHSITDIDNIPQEMSENANGLEGLF